MAGAFRTTGEGPARQKVAWATTTGIRRAVRPILALTGLFAFPSAAAAHVGYVLSQDEMAQKRGLDAPFLLEPFSQPLNVVLLLGGLAIAFALFSCLHRRLFLRKEIISAQEKLISPEETGVIPLVLRASLAIALLHAGIADLLISPTLPHHSQTAFLQIVLALNLLAGFLLPTTVFWTMVLFAFGLSQNSYLLGNAEFLAACLALLLTGDPGPGLDARLGTPYFGPEGSVRRFVPLVLRMGIGSALIFLAVYEKFLNPHLSAAVVEKYRLTAVIPVSMQMWVLCAGLVELGVGLALFLGFHTRLIAAIASAVLALSSVHFGEAVHAHVTLFGALFVLFVMGGGAWSLDNYLLSQVVAESRRRIGSAQERGWLLPSPICTEAAVRLLRGESIHAISRELGVPTVTLMQWRDQFLAGARAALKTRNRDTMNEENLPPVHMFFAARPAPAVS